MYFECIIYARIYHRPLYRSPKHSTILIAFHCLPPIAILKTFAWIAKHLSMRTENQLVYICSHQEIS